MEQNIKKRTYKREWAERELLPKRSLDGSITRLKESVGYSLPIIRKALRGITINETSFLIRKRAYEEFGFGFIS